LKDARCTQLKKIKRKENIMLPTRFHYRPEAALSRMVDDLFNRDINYVRGFENWDNTPRVNIAESSDKFIIELAAPGLQKENFHVEVEHNRLSISAKTEFTASEGVRITRREFGYGTFQRVFTLPQTVNTENVSAAYEAGVLRVELPKKEESVRKAARQVEIA
jgi:HSP20 family protein